MFLDQPIEIIETKRLDISLHIRRYDLLHPEISGNKQFKLSCWLTERKSSQALLSFGGAYSNHLLALSAAGFEKGIKTIGIIRGEELPIRNSWLQKMAENGMSLHFISREDYRKKETPEFLEILEDQFGDIFIIPEGGAGALGVNGAMDMVLADEPYDWIILPGGTGTTLAGICLKTKNSNTQILGMQVLKGDSILKNEVLRTSGINLDEFPNLQIFEDAHFGGYAKSTPELDEFRNSWFLKTGIELDPVYMGKAVFRFTKMLNEGVFNVGSRILIIHTGGNGPSEKHQN